MATTSVDYKHPYATITWQHQPTGGAWQDASLLSGYVGGQGTKTLELSGATEAETGFLRAEITNPAGASVYSDLATLSATAEAPNITVGISDPEPYEGESATYGPITVTGIPAPTLLWEAETADGNNTWADADTVFGADGSGQGTDTYVIANAVPADNRDVRVTATNTQGSDVSQAALTVTPTLAFTTDPQDKTILETVTVTPEYLIDFTLKDIGAWTHTRASDATAPNESGTIITYTTDQPAWYRDQGLQLEDTSTNDAWYATDWSQSQWVKSNITPSGIQLTANAGNATILQTITGASVERANAFDIRRISGSGTVEITGDGGTTWTPATITGTMTRFSVQATQTNPVVGIRIVTSGDAIEASWVNAEAGAFPTSRIPTSGAAYTRAATSCSATFAELGAPLPAGGVTNDFCVHLKCRMKTSLEDMGTNRFFTLEADAQNRVFVRGHNATAVHFHIEKGDVVFGQTVVLSSPLAIDDVADLRIRCSSALPSTLWLNDTKLVHASDSQADWPISLVNFGLAANGTAGNNLSNLIVESIRIVPEALTDEQIEAWT